MNKLNKHAQIGETMTWVIATIVVVLVLAISILATTFLGVLGSPKGYKAFKEDDLISAKSLMAYLLTRDDSGKRIFINLKNSDNFEILDGYGGALASKIFHSFLQYGPVWLGGIKGNLDTENYYFGSRYETLYGGSDVIKHYVSNIIKLDEKKRIELTFRANKYG